MEVEMSMRLHTFAILAYQQSPYLEQCIESLQAQTARSDLVIATSTPSAWLEQLAQRYAIPLSINRNPAGIAADWSYAYHLAATPYVTLAHQDDLYLPQYAERCLAIAQRYPANLIVFTDYQELVGQTIRGQGTLHLLIKKVLLCPFYVTPAIASPLLKRTILMVGDPIPCPSVMFHKHQIGPFEFDLEWLCALDWEAWLRLAQRSGDFVYVNTPLMVHRIHKDSETSRLIHNRQRELEEFRIFQQVWGTRLARILVWFYKIGAQFNKSKT